MRFELTRSCPRQILSLLRTANFATRTYIRYLPTCSWPLSYHLSISSVSIFFVYPAYLTFCTSRLCIPRSLLELWVNSVAVWLHRPNTSKSLSTRTPMSGIVKRGWVEQPSVPTLFVSLMSPFSLHLMYVLYHTLLRLSRGFWNFYQKKTLVIQLSSQWDCPNPHRVFLFLLIFGGEQSLRLRLETLNPLKRACYKSVPTFAYPSYLLKKDVEVTKSFLVVRTLICFQQASLLFPDFQTMSTNHNGWWSIVELNHLVPYLADSNSIRTNFILHITALS